MSNDLVKRLRTENRQLGDAELMDEAADRIEELEAVQTDLVRAGLEAAAKKADGAISVLSKLPDGHITKHDAQTMFALCANAIRGISDAAIVARTLTK